MLNIIKKPLVTEKNTTHGGQGVYVFEVHPKASKVDVRNAVEKAFRVKVEDVRTMNCRGRTKRTRVGVAAPVRWKKALVKLVKGEKIALFEGR